MKTVLVVDDDRSTRESVRMILKSSYNISLAAGGEEALELLDRDHIDLVILDILMPELDGMAVLQEIKKNSRAAVIILTGIKEIRTAVKAMKFGAADYLVKPFDTEELQLVVERIIRSRKKDAELDYLRAEIERDYPTEHIVAESLGMRRVLSQVERVAPTTSTVLISGESGTGKELIARAIHRQSRRCAMPFVAVQCAAIPEGILESELFGHEKGAFTGATRSRRGMFELADGGTLFLDEISEMSLSTQVKILRSLQEREFMRVGGQSPVKVDVRLIAASNRDLRDRIREGLFREDLYFRLSVIPLHIPPLREREEDVLPLADYFLKRFSMELHTVRKELSREVGNVLKEYEWPGNVRELKNVIERSVALEPSVQIIMSQHLHLDRGGQAEFLEKYSLETDGADSLEDAEQRLDRRLITDALDESSWNQTEAARRLGISRRKLKYRMDRLKILPKRGKGRPRLQSLS